MPRYVSTIDLLQGVNLLLQSQKIDLKSSTTTTSTQKGLSRQLADDSHAPVASALGADAGVAVPEN